MISFTCLNNEKRKKFKWTQESTRKDVGQTFGVLKMFWQVLHVDHISEKVATRRVGPENLETLCNLVKKGLKS